MLFTKKPITVAILTLLSTGAIPFAAANTISVGSFDDYQTDANYVDAANTNLNQKKSRKVKATAIDNSRIEDVLVTAQRRTETVQRVPAPVSVLGGKVLIESSVGRSAAEITKFVPNASAGQSGGNIRPRWWIRGVGTGTQGVDSPSPVGIYQDDIYLSNASATGFPLFDLERVEILRGPQGTLWGKNTTGGAINILSKKPSFENDGYIKLDKGSHDTTIVQGATGGSIYDDFIAARISFHQDTRDGAYHNLFTGTDSLSYADTAARAQILVTPNADVDILFNAHFRDYNSDGSNQTVIGTGAGGSYWTNGATYVPDTQRENIAANAAQSTDIKQDGAFVNVSWRLANEFEFTSITAFDGYESTAFGDTDATPLELSRNYAYTKTTQRSQEFRLASPKDGDLRWVIGAHYFDDAIDSDTVAATLPNAQKPAGRANAYNDTYYSHETESYAIFGNLTYNLTDRLAVTSGLRYSREEKSIDFIYAVATGNVSFNDTTRWWPNSAVATPIATRAAQVDTNEWSDWTWDFTPEFLLTDNSRIYAKIAKGFRGGGYNTSAKSVDTLSVINPEYLTSYEIGYKSEWLGGRLIANANVFSYDYDDIQINAVLPSPTGALSQLRNAAEGKANGAEIEINALLWENFQIKLGLGWLDTEFSEFTDLNGDYSGNRFVRSPEHSGVVSLDYRLPLADGSTLALVNDWNYQSEFFFFTNNQTNPNFTQKAYTTGSARVAWTDADDRLTLTVYANNITDENYKIHTLPGTSGATGNAVNWAEGRTFGASVTLKF